MTLSFCSTLVKSSRKALRAALFSICNTFLTACKEQFSFFLPSAAELEDVSEENNKI